MEEIRKALAELMQAAKVCDGVVESYIAEQKDNGGGLPPLAARDCNKAFLEVREKYIDVKEATGKFVHDVAEEQKEEEKQRQRQRK